MSDWNYAREESTNVGAGDHRFEVVSAEESIAKSSGNQMIVIAVKPNGAQFTVKSYFVKNEYFNRNMTSFFDSTGIKEGNFEFPTWIGAMGAARFKEDENGYLKVGYFIDKRKAEKLPPWIGDEPERQTVTEIGNSADDEESPF